ncbi:multimeric flavodoxin WrbA [Sporomusaceae bacterium BoRhaA]|uniref:flavodoxin family protein n=1 Tax=Pelorhabdus rhamnosifermentans TaxID=2772457 RepID=UPI001C0623D7|nr:flavodoxin family protein [Pelorhabdus rhamnosifermentans]MBU2700145.1 multimeric flavodoxin WrbA [Pelorhabdus rhamnosifermentans]
MRLTLFNGSPRKDWNTGILLKHVMKGAASNGAETELIHLYDLNYKGCRSCYACKRVGGKSYGSCAIQDDLTPIFKKVEESDALIFGSPIYYGNVTGEMRSFWERLLFPYSAFDSERSSLFKKKIRTGIIYTMAANEIQVREMGYEQNLHVMEMFIEKIFGEAESLFVIDTCHFEDYSQYVSTFFNAEEKLKRRQEEFPNDCQKAFEMGKKIVQPMFI